MKRQKKKRLPKWQYDFNCCKCVNMQEIHDDRKNRHGNYCVANIERNDAGISGSIRADKVNRVVRCDCFKEFP